MIYFVMAEIGNELAFIKHHLIIQTWPLHVPKHNYTHIFMAAEVERCYWIVKSNYHPCDTNEHGLVGNTGVSGFDVQTEGLQEVDASSDS